MKKFCLALSCCAGLAVGAVEPADFAQEQLKSVIPGSITLKAPDGWLHSRNELEHLSKGEFAGGRIAKVAKAEKNADPIPAIAAFHNDLKALGITLIVVPVPPKLAIHPFGGLKPGEAMKYLKPFYEELRAQGVDVLDLSADFLAAKEPAYCITDAHWSPAGIEIAAQKIADRMKFKASSAMKSSVKEAEVTGDLARSAKLDIKEKQTLKAIDGDVFDEKSPVLLLSDSHGLIFSSGGDMLAEKAGLGELLAFCIASPVDRIAVKGSAATAVRVNLYRKAAKDPQWLKNKKFVVWVFTCREFTETSSGWVKVPVLKK